jgi:hypothetical protein
MTAQPVPTPPHVPPQRHREYSDKRHDQSGSDHRVDQAVEQEGHDESVRPGPLSHQAVHWLGERNADAGAGG